MTYAARNAAVLESLDPVAKEVFAVFLQHLENVGEDVLLTSGSRTLAQQSALYAKGRTAPGNIVTNAKAGESIHNYGCAIDFVPIKNGAEDWKAYDRFMEIGERAKGFGCGWGGEWAFQDLPHLEYTQGITIAQFRAGMRPQKARTPEGHDLAARVENAEKALRRPAVTQARKNLLTRFIERAKRILLGV